MSNETIKLEADCAVATYNHLHHHHNHHHHHHHPHQNPHLQHHHNPIAIHGSIHDHHHSLLAQHVDDDEDEDDMIEGDEEQENKGRATELSSQESLDRNQIDHSNIYDTQKLSDPNALNCEQVSLINQTNGDKFTQLENVHPHEHQNIQKDVIRLHQERLSQPLSSSPSSSIDSSETSEEDELESEEEGEDEDDEDDEEDDEDEKVDEDEADDEYADDDGDEEGEDEVEEDEDEIDEEEESQDEDNAIVDPVGTHHYLHPRGSVDSSGSKNMIDANQTAIGDSIASVNGDDYNDVPFLNEYDGTSVTHNPATSDLLYSERMLEVTRKLVRSTERDPDRDLRKQVLLRTAIRKLPHFMEYNHYSETFDQNFRLHNNTINDNNNTSALECLSPSQYYEHHSIHHLEQQPKSYYHSVQPNAIQMSTTSLRMLDLNDDPDAEFAVTTPIDTKQHMSYEGAEHGSVNLDQQHEYANSNLYNSYPQHNNEIQAPTLSLHNDQRTIIHDFNQYSTSNQRQESTHMISRHDTLENLYQPLEASEIADSSKSPVEHAGYQAVQECNRVCVSHDSYNRIDVAGPDSQVKIEGHGSDETDSSITVYDAGRDTEIVTKLDQEAYGNNELDQSHPREDCNATTPNNHGGPKEGETHDCNASSLPTERPFNEADSGLIEDNIESSNSSQSSTSSEDSANSSASHSNDSSGDNNGISLLETSLNPADDYQHCSNDSGLALFSPKANKRTSSSIGLDEEMEVDHLSEIPTSDLINNTGTVANHYKKLRKRELSD